MSGGNFIISEKSLKQISHIFCDDTEEYYTYKKGIQLVTFFNRYYGSNDTYGQGFPSRWMYVYNKLVELININKVNTFFDIVLSKEYLMSEQSISQVEAAEKANIIWNELNHIVQQAAYRYADAGQLSSYFEKTIIYNKNLESKKNIDDKIKKNVFDDEIENYIYNLPGIDISQKMQSTSEFSDILFKFMDIDDTHAQHIIQSIDKTYQSACKHSFEAYDVFSSFAKKILLKDYSFVVKEIAAGILRYIAWDVNRFSAQHMVEDIIISGIEPLLEEKIKS